MVGQTIELRVKLTDTVASLKQQIHDEFGIPPGKQTLKADTMLSDGTTLHATNTFAHYNMASGENATVTLCEKSRGK